MKIIETENGGPFKSVALFGRTPQTPQKPALSVLITKKPSTIPGVLGCVHPDFQCRNIRS